jgi:hypothetical protein
MEPYLLPPSRTYLRNIAELITGANRLLNSWSPKNTGTQPVQGMGTLKEREACLEASTMRSIRLPWVKMHHVA